MIYLVQIFIRLVKDRIIDDLRRWQKEIRHATIRVKHPRLQFDNTCDVTIKGDIVLNGIVCLGSRTRIILFKGSKLILGGDNQILNDVLIAPQGLISIGYGTSIQDRCTILGDVKIGSLSLLAPNTFVSSGRHQFEGGEYISAFVPIKIQDYLVPFKGKKISVGDDVWLGTNSVVLPGVRIGNGTIIGANSIVRRDTETYGVYAGIPARKLRSRWIGTSRQIKGSW